MSFEDRTGTILEGKYEILKKIGQGGMSIVYVAMDIRLNKQWAIKEIKNDTSKNRETLIKGLEMEANILKRVDHPVLPRIVDIIDKDGTVYVVMDYIEGRALDKVLEEEGAQPEEKVIEWAKQLASALEYLHTMNPPIIYRDMKPSNIMLKPDGTVKLIDFGTAKEYKTENIADTTALGTRGYAAPEQFGDKLGKGIYKTDARTDIYCLGATLYHIVTGKNPAQPPYEIRPIREWDISLSSGLEKIILKCTQLNPEDRYQSGAELIYNLEHYKQLEQPFIKKEKRKLFSFLVCSFLCMLSFFVCIYGKNGMETERKQDYRTLIEEANNYKIAGEYLLASEKYVQAITEVDGANAEAYLQLLNLYKNYMETEEGLSRIEGYINSGYHNIQQNSEVVYQVAITYFNELNDYKSSLKYFRMVNSEEIPEAVYYSSLAMALSELNLDYEEIGKQLAAFQEYNTAVTDVNARLINARALGKVYTSYINYIPQAAECSIKVAEDAFDYLSYIEDDSLLFLYELEFSRQLAVGYRKLAQEAETEKKAAANYLQAIEYSRNVLTLVSAKENPKLCAQIYCDIAEMYAEMGENQKAQEEYEKGEKAVVTENIALYVGHLKFLYNLEAEKGSDYTKWNMEELLAHYTECEKIPEINNNLQYKKIKQKLEAALLEMDYTIEDYTGAETEENGL
ncbi:MAG: serine/threonine-protein kinase [Lachnospiraceae bacterium]|nr:serine/threonine-protein kinase [Lachnospiraceae bacterium]